MSHDLYIRDCYLWYGCIGFAANICCILEGDFLYLCMYRDSDTSLLSSLMFTTAACYLCVFALSVHYNCVSVFFFFLLLFSPCHLFSGGEDFTVRLWDVMQGVLIYTFSMHGGIVRHLLCLPPSNAPRLQSCLCSVADDHSVAIISLKECRCLLMAASHVFPVAGIRWRLAHDFLLVACTDGTLYVWEIETGQLDRCVNGSVAADILGAGQDYHGSGVLDPTGEHSSAVVSGKC